MIWRKITLKLKWGWNDFFKVKPSLKQVAGEIRVLCFHGVCEDDRTYINGRFLKEGRLVSLMKQLKETCNIISYADFEAENLAVNRLNILITFDDAYLNNKTTVLPCIESLEIPVLLFATCNQGGFWMDFLDLIMTKPQLHRKLEEKLPSIKGLSNGELKRWMMNQPVDKQTEFRDTCKNVASAELTANRVFWEVMSEKELQEMASSPFVTIANHSVTHPSFPLLTVSEMIDEISACDKYMSQVDKKSVRAFAYPFGHYDQTTIQTLKKQGVKHQFIADGTLNAPEGTIDRLVINPFISERNQLFAIKNGRY